MVAYYIYYYIKFNITEPVLADESPMRASFLGCPIDLLTMAETVELARGAMRSHRRLQHVALNVAKWEFCGALVHWDCRRRRGWRASISSASCSRCAREKD